jgi:hypothetical protein
MKAEENWNISDFAQKTKAENRCFSPFGFHIYTGM